MLTYLKEIVLPYISEMILHLFHDGRCLGDMAYLKDAIEVCYGTYGLRVQDRGYLYVPLKGRHLDAAKLLRYLEIAANRRASLWIIGSKIFYPGTGLVFGCSAEMCAVLSAAEMEPEMLAKEALHEVGHLLGLGHCSKACVMSLSGTMEHAKEKPSSLCSSCSEQIGGTGI